MTTFKSKELLDLPNLISLSRIILGPLILIILATGTSKSIVVASAVLVIAGLTDALDGYLARKRGQITRLGIVLDPVADKIFALFLLVSLVLFRDLPYWLAAVILGRDLIILTGGVILSHRAEIALPSNITGKYTFASIAVLLGCFLIGDRFGIRIMMPIVLVLTVASLLSYSRVFRTIAGGGRPTPYEDTRVTRYLRLSATAVVSIVIVIGWITQLLQA